MANEQRDLIDKLESPSAVVHIEYDMANPPPHRGPSWTRFVCISDTHAHVFPVPDGDVLLHSGDITNTGKLGDFQTSMGWLYELPHPTKIIIAGNHDLTLHRGWYEQNYDRWHRKKMESPQKVEPIYELLKGEKAKKARLVYLEDEEYTFQAKEGGRTWSVYGSPWSPWFYDWAFNYNRGPEAEKLISKFPKTDILLTHGPPHGILDQTLSEDHVGCEALAARLPHLQPRLHLFGHIHEAHGAELRAWNENASTVFVNAANWPMGPRCEPARKMGQRPSFGGPGFRPIIVDLLD
ncbi:Metallo-dependent phosphatase [Gloeophyllum trabeum ATCC 11539]|uniref:Metallo-dependent phosphatase n=1 Tax=Gloeophyllum trabeum (strain ATCC 11539 / FP-39264 / Madison 617) TaxID=670483 RepID=S7RXE5_GLOTA|nr:Metallo-dependent phosphatase [Gloeophyllum trabeum ATCC 11539]EPQ58009.1 Metallo-dependent phosphatase [Gloeophyllum trabeum ATCC 11539]